MRSGTPILPDPVLAQACANGRRASPSSPLEQKQLSVQPDRWPKRDRLCLTLKGIKNAINSAATPRPQ